MSISRQAKKASCFLTEIPDVPRFERGPQPVTVSKFDLKTRKTEPFLGGVNGFTVSANGEKVLYRQGPGWFIAATAAAPKPGDGALKISAMEVYVDPRVEWNQMYREDVAHRTRLSLRPRPPRSESCRLRKRNTRPI